MPQLKLKALAKGLATYIPVLREYACRSSGGTVAAEYCYSVWLRHLVRAAGAGLDTSPACVAELGPGDSFGIGLAAILTGAREYRAFDALPHANVDRNLAIFDDLVALFRRRAPIPNDESYPLVFPRLKRYDFPALLLPEARLAEALRPDRLAAIRGALREEATVAGIRITYAAPWNDRAVIEPASIDMVLSQAVLEHVEDVHGTYAALGQWLKAGGFMSHAIDFQSHGLTRDWNGHWTVSDRAWKLVRGRRPYLINRWAHSAHLAAIREAGFRVVTDERQTGPRIAASALAPRYRSLCETDRETPSVFVQAVRVGRV